jgi:hypothetical protein
MGFTSLFITMLCAGFILFGCTTTKSTLKKLETFELDGIGISIDGYDDSINIENIVSHLPNQDVVNQLGKKYDIRIQTDKFQDKEMVEKNIERFVLMPFWSVAFEKSGNNIITFIYYIDTKDKKFSVIANINVFVDGRLKRLRRERIKLNWKLIEDYLKHDGSNPELNTSGAT